MLVVKKFMPEAVRRGWVIENNEGYRPSPKGLAVCESLVQYDDFAWQIYEDSTEDTQGAAVMAILLRAISAEPAWLRFLRRFTG